METALYGIFTLVGFVSEISLVRCAHSFDFRYLTNSSENPVRTRFPWSNLNFRVFTHSKKAETSSYERMLISKSRYLSLFNVFFFSTKYFIIFGKVAEQGHRGLARAKDHILYKVILTFESVDETHKFDNSYESFWITLSCGIVCYVVHGGSNFRVYARNCGVWLFKAECTASVAKGLNLH